MGETADRFLLCVLLIGSLGSRSTAQTFQHRYDALDQLKTEVGFGIERANNSTYMLFLGSAKLVLPGFYNMIQKKQPYSPQPLEEYHEKVRKLKIKQIQRTIAKFELKEDEFVSLFA